MIRGRGDKKKKRGPVIIFEVLTCYTRGSLARGGVWERKFGIFFPNNKHIASNVQTRHASNSAIHDTP
jgi:hypothetical protein